jgi:hypothetical protein
MIVKLKVMILYDDELKSMIKLFNFFKILFMRVFFVNALDFCFDISKIIEISLVFIYLSMQLKIISMNQIAFSGHVDEVIIPTEIGEISILPDHQPLTSIVRPGLVGIIPAQPTDT